MGAFKACRSEIKFGEGEGKGQSKGEVRHPFWVERKG